MGDQFNLIASLVAAVLLTSGAQATTVSASPPPGENLARAAVSPGAPPDVEELRERNVERPRGRLAIVEGFATSGTLREANATAYLQAWDGQSWVGMAQVATNSVGYYGWRVPPGFTYQVRVEFLNGSFQYWPTLGNFYCTQWWAGTSASWLARRGRRHTLNTVLNPTGSTKC